MRPSLLENIQAIRNSSTFIELFSGIPIQLSIGQFTLQIEKTTQDVRPIGLRFSRYSYISIARIGEHVGYGYGEAETKLISVQKSMAEAVERVVFKTLKNTSYGTPNSNGWATHLSFEKAQNSALHELLERDAVLLHWFTQTPLREISPQSFPSWLKKWIDTELLQSQQYKNLRLLVSTLGHLPTVTAVLEDGNHYAVLSHATAKTLDVAVYKAIAETCRIAHILQDESQFEYFPIDAENSAIGPMDHAFFYKTQQRLPEWLFGVKTLWTEHERHWKHQIKKFSPKKIKFTTKQYQCGSLTIAQCKSDEIQNLFFGRTEEAHKNGLINIRRLKEVGMASPTNWLPHCVM